MLKGRSAIITKYVGPPVPLLSFYLLRPALIFLAILLNLPVNSGEFIDTSVREIQEKLSRCGFLPQKQVDGFWGPVTKTALMSFQSSRGLDADSIAGQLTVSALNKCSSPKIARPFSLKEKDISHWKILKVIPLQRQSNDFLSPVASQIWVNSKSIEKTPGFIQASYLQRAVFRYPHEAIAPSDVHSLMKTITINCLDKSVIRSGHRARSIFWTRYGNSPNTAAALLYKAYCNN